MDGQDYSCPTDIWKSERTLRNFRFLTLLSILVAAISLAGGLSATEPDKPESKTAFVDLDGDGFNDAATDANNDGIPDPELPPTETISTTVGMQVRTISLMASTPQTPILVSQKSWKATFGQRRLAALGLTAFRCDLGVGSNDVTSAAGGVGGGGACAGGVCLPH